MKHLIFLLILAFAITFSCKKKDDYTPPILSTTGATTSATAGTTTGGAQQAATFSGVCSNQKIYSIISGMTYSVTNPQNTALFTNITFNNFNVPAGPLLYAGTISLNGIVFKNNLFYYSDTTNTAQAGPFLWNGSGGVVPAFTVTNTNSYPTYADYVYWPDTIHVSQGINISLLGARNADEAQISIYNSGTSPSLSYTALVSVGSVSVSPANLTVLSTSTTAIIYCNLYKNNIQSIGTNQVNFRNIISFIKTVPVKN